MLLSLRDEELLVFETTDNLLFVTNISGKQLNNPIIIETKFLFLYSFALAGVAKQFSFSSEPCCHVTVVSS